MLTLLFGLPQAFKVRRQIRKERREKELYDDGYGYIMTQYFKYLIPLERLQDLHDAHTAGDWNETNEFDKGCGDALWMLHTLEELGSMSIAQLDRLKIPE